jgi:hypothetical protein
MNVSDIISKALVEYDSAIPVIKYLIENTRANITVTDNDRVRSSIQFINEKTNEIVIDTEIEILAIFYEKLKIWCWSWSLTGLTNSQNYLSKEILLYALKLDVEMSYIKSILTTSRGIIDDISQIDINLAIGASIIKMPYIYPFLYKINDSYLIYYMILINKTDLDNLHLKLKKEMEME